MSSPSKSTPNRLWIFVALFIGMGIILVVMVRIELDIKHELEQVRALIKKPPASMTISLDGQSTTIDDPTVIVELFRHLISAQKVQAHHSSPVNVMRLDMPGINRTYLLGGDSTEPFEFWFSVITPETNSQNAMKLRQVRSKEIALWLVKHVTLPKQAIPYPWNEPVAH